MIETSQYLLYKTLKKKINISYRSYALQPILANDFAFFSYGIKKSSFSINDVKYLLFFIHVNFDFYKQLQLPGVIFSFNNYGKDYWDMLQSISSKINGSKIIKGFPDLKKRINFKHIVVSFFQILFIRWGAQITYKDKFYFYLRLVHYKNIIDDFEENGKKVQTKKFVPFLSPLVMDSILCQFFKIRNIPVYGIQHGVHCSHQYHPHYIPFDVVNIENFQADYMLGWGEFTKEVLISEGYPETSYVLAGNPKYSDFKEIKVKNEKFQTCIICLARDVYDTYNLELLHIAGLLKSKGFKVCIKMHPRSNPSLYQSLINQYGLVLLDPVMSVLESIHTIYPDFVIVYNSTVYYEYYINNVIAFRFGVYANDIPFGMDDEFSSFEELREKMRGFQLQSNEDLNVEINKVINRFCALGVNNYTSILNTIH